MALDLYQKLCDLNLLKRAWHIARNDSRTAFMYDPYRYSDFGFHLEEYLQNLSQRLRNGSYHPKPLQKIDVPKSSFSVRPGSVLQIEDKIVLFAITCLIAPPLDKRLPPNVYSWRLKKNPKRDELFHDNEILEFTFLKGTTIRKRIEFVEPWYAAWPHFMEESERLYEKEGYQFLVVSDIVAYFENIDLDLLRTLLLQELPQQAKIINFLINLLEYWAWPTPHGAVAPRGIPQGNGVSSFLGNLYLLPLDRAFLSLTRRLDLKYLRYMDDVKVLSRTLASAREALFLMNDKLRGLRLNIQGAKTRILQGKEVEAELFDPRLTVVNDVIQDVLKNPNLTTTGRKQRAASLRIQLRKITGRKGIIRDKELRTYLKIV
nr:RNA-directed DNA polymerase [Nitrosomonas nitrosa]